jgi:hypothetical protein
MAYTNPCLVKDFCTLNVIMLHKGILFVLAEEININTRTYRFCGFHSLGYKEFCLLKYNVRWSVWSQSTFRRNVSSSSGLKNWSSACCLLHVGSALGFRFDPDEANMFLWYIGSLSTDYTALCARRRNSAILNSDCCLGQGRKFYSSTYKYFTFTID